ncbi:hypothetical protein BDP81DRAFT_46058 [Colletotrichum phormii]|uniref:Uncharacterized protein n=1 Tax=Colletotrichum phormii TaxID=359342 RepID=A0AAI9ZNB8_9PEZI|nr:uncharacterized protein BDP81DRAFT_46058 [Colletotrichum phormii]KAK1635150.1 hypothetical protein BDP81DRAFT_46058 [Colletotrichum phormii]
MARPERCPHLGVPPAETLRRKRGGTKMADVVLNSMMLLGLAAVEFARRGPFSHFRKSDGTETMEVDWETSNPQKACQSGRRGCCCEGGPSQFHSMSEVGQATRSSMSMVQDLPNRSTGRTGPARVRAGAPSSRIRTLRPCVCPKVERTCRPTHSVIEH